MDPSTATIGVGFLFLLVYHILAYYFCKYALNEKRRKLEELTSFKFDQPIIGTVKFIMGDNTIEIGKALGMKYECNIDSKELIQ